MPRRVETTRSFTMKKQLLIAGIAAAGLMGGIASAGELYNINASEQYVSVPTAFIHQFAIADCAQSNGGIATGQELDPTLDVLALTGDPATRDILLDIALSADPAAPIDTTRVGTCEEHGQVAAEAWANGADNNTSNDGSAFFAGTGSQAGGVDGDGNIIGTEFVPQYDSSPTSGYRLPNSMNAFASLNQDGTAGDQNSASLPTAWTSQLVYDGDLPLTAPTSIAGATDLRKRDEWVDQILIGYIATGDNFAMNFRSSLTFGDDTYNPDSKGSTIDRSADGSEFPANGADFKRSEDCLTDIAACATIIDQRLEQGDTDMENYYDNARHAAGDADLYTNNLLAPVGSERLMSAFQQTFSAVGNVGNMTSTTGDLDNTGGTSPNGFEDFAESSTARRQAQNVEQNMEGFFYSCLNCNIGNEHSFSAPKKLTMQSWLVDNPTITSIIHTRAATQTNRRSGAFNYDTDKDGWIDFSEFDGVTTQTIDLVEGGLPSVVNDGKTRTTRNPNDETQIVYQDCPTDGSFVPCPHDHQNIDQPEHQLENNPEHKPTGSSTASSITGN